MVGTNDLDTGQFLTYLFIYMLPHIIRSLADDLVPRDPVLLKSTIRIFLAEPPWFLRGTHRAVSRKKVKRYKKPRVRLISEGDKKLNRLRDYLFPLAAATFWVGCRMEILIRRIRRLGRPPPRFTALNSVQTHADESYLRFDSDSYTIGVDNHASRCMANSPHLFTDLKLIPQGKQVEGIGAGLQIEGVGTYVMRLQDDKGKLHEIKIPNSLFLPKLRRCLLSPQHWAQEAKARGNKGKWSKTWMENHWDKCILLWGNGQFRKSIPHHPSTNTPIFHSAPSSKAYHAFVATFEACDAFYRNEHVLQVPGLGKHHDPDEFIANENINLRHANYPDAAKVREDDETIKTSNRSEHSPPPSYEPSEQS